MESEEEMLAKVDAGFLGAKSCMILIHFVVKVYNNAI